LNDSPATKDVAATEGFYKRRIVALRQRHWCYSKEPATTQPQ